MSLQTLLLPQCHHHQAPGMNGCPFFWAAFQIWMICMLPPNMEIWYGNIVSYVRACMSLFTITSNLSPKSCEKRGHDAACSFRGSRDTSAKPFGFNWYDVFTTMTLSFGPVIFRGIQYGRSAGDRSIPRQRPPFATCNLVKSTTSTTTSQNQPAL